MTSKWKLRHDETNKRFSLSINNDDGDVGFVDYEKRRFVFVLKHSEVVSKSTRGRGVGTQLAEAVITAILKSNPRHKIVLECDFLVHVFRKRRHLHPRLWTSSRCRSSKSHAKT